MINISGNKVKEEYFEALKVHKKISGFWMEGERWDYRGIKTNNIYLQMGKMCKNCGKIPSWKPYIVRVLAYIRNKPF